MMLETNDVSIPDGGGASAEKAAAVVAATPSSSASSSNAKRRMEAMATSVDNKLVAAFSTILVLYAVITFGTWLSLEAQPYRSEVIEIASTTHQLGLPHHLKVTVPVEITKVQGTPATVRQEAIPSSAVSKADDTTKTKIVKAESASVATADNPNKAIVQQQQQQQQQHPNQDIETLQHTFPVHAGHDLEMIDHPGILLANREGMLKILMENPSLPHNGKMLVPKFWEPQAYGPGGVREFLGQNGRRLITPEEAAQIGSYNHEGLETVYISVASYRDPECQPTVSDIFERADHPERLRVAIVDQRVQGEDDVVPPCGKPPVPCTNDPNQAMCKYAHLIDVYQVPAILSVGPVFARHLAHRMYRGEYFAMQVDSHVRFIEHWDTSLIDQWRSAKNEMAVITTYLSDITDSIDPVTHANNHPNRPIMCKTDYEGNGKLKHLRHGQQPEGLPGIHGEPTLHPFWAAGFSFARGHFVVQVPYDQYQPMVFQGEEIFMGLRGFTYGYDYYTAEISVAFHMYAIKKNKEKRKKIKLFWENSNLYPGSAIQGMKRLNGIIGTGDPGDEFYHGEEQKYGLGQARNKDKFYRLYGIHTESKTVEDHLCSFVGRPMMKEFKPYLRENRMGIDFSQIDYEYKDPNPPKKETKKLEAKK